MSFIPEIYNNRDKYFLNFANEFFGKNFWIKVIEEDKYSCILLCGFFTIIKSRCNTSKSETSEIVYNSLKEKFSIEENYEEFSAILEKNNQSYGFKSVIPFLNSDIKKVMNSFEKMYLFYETKMHEKGEI